MKCGHAARVCPCLTHSQVNVFIAVPSAGIHTLPGWAHLL